MQKFILKNKIKLILGLVILLAIGFLAGKKLFPTKVAPNYTTDKAQRGTLITSVTASGSISSGSNVDITTQASGVVDKVYVQNGDSVTAGQQIAHLILDQSSQQKQAAAWSSYLSAKNQLTSAQTDLSTLQNAEFTANQKFINDAVARGLTTNDPTYIEENSTWLAAEANYKNQQSVIDQAQASVNSSYLSYLQISSIITAPATGTVTGLTLTPGFPVTISSTSSSSSSGQSLGSITLESGNIQATVNLAEIDVPKIKVGDKATITLDAFPDKTFAGTVTAINTQGIVSSGVTTYPVTVTLDTSLGTIYPNMGVNATIITSVKDNVLLIPSQAVQTQNGQSTVRALINGQAQTVPVTIGDSSDTQTEIISGLSEGDTVVTGSPTIINTTGGSGSSPFSRGFGGGGGVVFRGRGG